MDYGETEQLAEALELAIEALKSEPCEDAISRQAMLDGLASIAKVKAKSDAQKALMGRVMFFTEQLPPVTPKQKTGKWTDDKCSVCGKGIEDLISSPEWYRNKEPKFCPFCGTKMEGESE